MAVVGDSSIYRSSFSSLQAQHTSKERRFASLSPFFRISAEFWTPALSRLTIKPSSRYAGSSHFSCQSGREPHSWHVLGIGLVSGIQARCSAQSDCFHGFPFHQDPHTSFGTVSLKMTASFAPLNLQRILCNRNLCNRQTKRFQGSTVVACVPADGMNVGITLGVGEKNGHSGLSGICADSALPIDNSAISDSSVNASAGDEASVEHLKGVLQSALEELDLARLNSSKIEEDAQAITERAIALRDKAVTAEAKAENAAATVSKIQNEELGLEGRLSKERVALAEAEARVLLAEKALSQAKQAASSSLPDFTQVGPQDIVENASSFVLQDSSAEVEALDSASVANDVSDKSISETSTLSKEEEELAAAEAELKACRVAVTQYETELMRLTNSKLDMQREAIGLVDAAKVARAIAIAADEEVTQVMSLAEQAVAVEVEAAQKVCIAEIALQKAERLASEELHSDATVASTQVESVGNTGDALQGESAVEADNFAARGMTDGPEVEALEKVPELEQIKPFAGSFEAAEIIDDTVKRISVALKVEGAFQEPEVEKVKSEKQQKEVVKEAPSVAVPKSSTKRSSRFFSASYFSSKDDEEFTPTSVFQGIREHFLKVSVGVLLLCGGSILLKNRMESQPQLLERTEFVSEVTSSAKPFVKELRRLPRRVQKMLEKIPHQEVNEEEASLFDVLWLLLASVIFVPIFQKLPGGSPVLGYLAAGVLIGPYSLSIIRHVHGTKAIAEFGVVFLLFNIGLELSVERLSSMKKYVFGLGTSQVLMTALVVGLVSHFVCGFSGPAALVVGNGLALSSTAVVLQMGHVKRPEWQYVDQVKACKKGQWTCKCKFCGHTWDGGPARIRYHLLKMAGHGVGPCDQVPDAVKEVVTRLHADARGDGTDRNDYVNELVNAMGEEASQSVNDATASTHASDSSKSKKRKGYEANLGSAFHLQARKHADQALRRFFYAEDIPEWKVRSPFFLEMVKAIGQVLQERGESTSRHGRATFSVLLFQDLAVVVLLILLPLISPSSSKGGVGFQAIAEALGVAAIKGVVAIAAIIAGGRLLLRPIYKRMAENHNAEIFAANTLFVVLGTSVLTARAGLSMALGAFLAGLLLAETEFALQVESDIAPYRGLLLGLFFMTVYAPGDTLFLDFLHIRDKAGQIRADVTGGPD
ncbi:hypothetical protein L7F22_057998 [Adiantum nelumboides]|nr:hypothetical protein [Adiantum nelumboides]